MKINKKKFGNVMIIVSCLMTIIMFGTFVAGFFIDNEPTGSLTSFDYTIGKIDANGRPIESRKGIYTKKIIMCESLDKVEKMDDSSVICNVHLYDENGKYLGKASGENYKTYGTGDDAVKVGGFRIEILPLQIDTEYPDITLLTIAKYVNQVEVTYTK